VDIRAATQDREWLSQATRALAKYWQGKNQRKKTTRSGMPTFDAVA